MTRVLFNSFPVTLLQQINDSKFLHLSISEII